eukprot:TRINITY_DN10792_c0_g1_i1.p1 TRINITY_DN10792_c0_g1~~TRINITY_DN10792_c0_g1_i1.p1  ORF type:complete len:587 (+),score=98.12 TRINITY_DN10792_c0_g1_i1:122-1882(+)
MGFVGYVYFLYLFACIGVHGSTTQSQFSNDPNRIRFSTPGWNDLMGDNVAITPTHLFIAAPGISLPGRVEILQLRGTSIINIGRSGAFDHRSLCDDGKREDGESRSWTPSTREIYGSSGLQQKTKNNSKLEQGQIYRMIQSRPVVKLLRINQSEPQSVQRSNNPLKKSSVPPSAAIQQYEYTGKTPGPYGKVAQDYATSLVSMGKVFAVGSQRIGYPIQTGGVIVSYYIAQAMLMTVSLRCTEALNLAGSRVGCMLAYGNPYIISVACGNRSIVVFRYVNKSLFTCFHYQPTWGAASIDSVGANPGFFVFSSITSKTFEVFVNVGLDAWKSHAIVQIPSHLDMQGSQVSDFGAAAVVDNEIVAIGAPGVASMTGCVVIYVTDTLEIKQILWPPGNSTYGRFGSRIAISGNYMAISATACSPNMRQCGMGTVYLYRKDGQLLQTFQSLDGLDGDMYGIGLSLNHFQLMVGATRQFSSLYGAAYLYQANNTAWDDSYVWSPTETVPPTSSQSFAKESAQYSHSNTEWTEGNDKDDNTTVVAASSVCGALALFIGFGIYRRKYLGLRQNIVNSYSEKDAASIHHNDQSP